MSQKKNKLYVSTAVLCCVLLAACSSKVSLSSGRYPSDSAQLTAVIQEDDIAALDSFVGLSSVDFTGSICYEAITDWAQAHPDIEVRYTVEMPWGEAVDNSVTSLDLSTHPAAEIQQAAELLQYLPALETVSIGSSKLDPEAFCALAAGNPNIDFTGAISAGGMTIDLHSTELDLTGISRKDAPELIAILPYMSSLERIQLGSDENANLTWEDIAALEAACPQAEVEYAFTLYGKHFTLSSTSMIISHKPVEDNGELVRRVIACMPELTYLDMDSCGVGDEDMAAIRDDFPNVDVVWRIWFGKGYSVRTDVDTILASNPDAGGELNSTNSGSLKYCTKVKYLDLGHNVELEDISFVSYMPDLEVAILAMVRITDFSPLADCPHLEFLELGASGLHDLTPLSNLKELRHLSVASDPCLFDISPLYGLTELERLWISPWTPISQDQIDKMQECAPNCYIDLHSKDNNSYDVGYPGWRYIGYGEDGHAILHPRYILLWSQFNYGAAPYCYAYSSNDPLYYVSSEP